MIEAMTINETAQKLRISPSMVRKMIAIENLPHVRFGKRVVIDMADLDKWIESKKIGGNHERTIGKENNRIGPRAVG